MHVKAFIVLKLPQSERERHKEDPDPHTKTPRTPLSKNRHAHPPSRTTSSINAPANHINTPMMVIMVV